MTKIIIDLWTNEDRCHKACGFLEDDSDPMVPSLCTLFDETLSYFNERCEECLRAENDYKEAVA